MWMLYVHTHMAHHTGMFPVLPLAPTSWYTVCLFHRLSYSYLSLTWGYFYLTA